MSSSKELLQTPVGQRPPSPPESKHYDAARKGWNDRLENEMRSTRSWRFATLGVGLIAVGALAGLIVVANKPAPEPRFVEVHSDGSMRLSAPSAANFRAGDREYRYFLGQWIELVRNVSLDPVVVKNNWQRAYAFTTPQAANKLNAWANQPDSAQKKVGLETVTAQVVSVLPVSADSYQARWIETTFTDQGQVKNRATWTATFTVKQEPNVPAGMDLINPGGLFITDFNWNSDLATQ